MVTMQYFVVRQKIWSTNILDINVVLGLKGFKPGAKLSSPFMPGRSVSSVKTKGVLPPVCPTQSNPQCLMYRYTLVPSLPRETGVSITDFCFPKTIFQPKFYSRSFLVIENLTEYVYATSASYCRANGSIFFSVFTGLFSCLGCVISNLRDISF